LAVGTCTAPASDIDGLPRIALDSLTRSAILVYDGAPPLKGALDKSAVFDRLLTTSLAPVD